MAQSVSYRAGVFTRRHPMVTAFLFGIPFYVIWIIWQTEQPLSSNAPPTTTHKGNANAVNSVAPIMDKICSNGLEALVIESKALAAKGQIVAAYDKLYPCRDSLQTSVYASYYKQALTAFDAATTAALQKATASEQARKKREGVALGMSPEDALASNWGKPDHINRTHRASGTSEQWVYSRSGYKNAYLYFENGVLTTIQN